MTVLNTVCLCVVDYVCARVHVILVYMRMCMSVLAWIMLVGTGAFVFDAGLTTTTIPP